MKVIIKGCDSCIHNIHIFMYDIIEDKCYRNDHISPPPSPRLQRRMMDNLEVVCDHLPNPGKSGQICRQQVEQILPIAISFITNTVVSSKLFFYTKLHLGSSSQSCPSICFSFVVFVLKLRWSPDPSLPIYATAHSLSHPVQKPEQVCSFLGLCGSHLEDGHERQLISDIHGSLRAAMEALDLSDMPWAREASKLTVQRIPVLNPLLSFQIMNPNHLL